MSRVWAKSENRPDFRAILAAASSGRPAAVAGLVLGEEAGKEEFSGAVVHAPQMRQEL
jgi:hypothetical protein